MFRLDATRSKSMIWDCQREKNSRRLEHSICRKKGGVVVKSPGRLNVPTINGSNGCCSCFCFCFCSCSCFFCGYCVACQGGRPLPKNHPNTGSWACSPSKNHHHCPHSTFCPGHLSVTDVQPFDDARDDYEVAVVQSREAHLSPGCHCGCLIDDPPNP
jgi:hypothetical protein